MHTDGHSHAPADVGAVGGRLPGRVVAPRPADGLRAHFDALGQATALDNLGEAFPPLAHRLGHRQILPRFHPILAFELHRVPAHRQGDLFHMLLQAEEGLGRAVAPERAWDRFVGVDHIAVEAGRGQPVGAQRPKAGDHLDGQPVGSIRAGLGQNVQVDAQEFAVFVHPGAEAQPLGVAGASAAELLLPGVFKLHRSPGGNRQVGAEVFDEHLLLAAEAAADAGFHHPDAAHGQAEQGRNHPPHVEGNLRAGADDQPVVLVPVGEDDVGFDAGLLHLMHPVFALVDEVGLGQRGLDVVVLHVEFDGDVAGRVVNLHRVGLVVDDGRAVGHCLFRAEDCGQNLVLDANQFQRLLDQFRRLRGDNRHPVAHVAHFVVQADLIVGGRLGIALAAAGVDDPRHVQVGEDRVDAGQLLRRAFVDAEDAGVGVGAGKQAAVEYPRHLHVVGKDGPPLHQLHSVHLRLRFVDHLRLGRRNSDGKGAGAGLGLHAVIARTAVGPVRGKPAIGRGPLEAAGRVPHVDFQRVETLPPHLRGGAQDSLHRLCVARAAAEDAGNRLPHLPFGRVRVVVQQLLRGQELGGCAVAALDGPAGDELALQRGEGDWEIGRLGDWPVGGKSLRRDNRRAVGLGGEKDAAVEQAVAGGFVRRVGEQHRVRAGFAGLVAVLDAVVAQAAQGCAQQFAGVDGQVVLGSVDGEGDVHRCSNSVVGLDGFDGSSDGDQNVIYIRLVARNVIVGRTKRVVMPEAIVVISHHPLAAMDEGIDRFGGQGIEIHVQEEFIVNDDASL